MLPSGFTGPSSSSGSSGSSGPNGPSGSRGPSRKARLQRSWGAVVVALGIALTPGCHDTSPSQPTASAPQTWRFAIEEVQGSVQHAYAMAFKKRIEARTGGDVRVIVYPHGTLGSSDHLTELVHGGAIELVMASPGYLGKLIPEVQVFLLHYLFSKNERANAMALRDERLRGALDSLYARKNLKLLSVFSEGWQVWTANTAIRRPEDFAGLKMRVMPSPLLLETYRAYGANPTPLPYAEVYSGLQLSMIDGQVNPVFAIEEMSFYEVSRYMIFPRAALFITTVAANRQFVQSLAPQRRKLFMQVLQSLDGYIEKKQQHVNAKRLERIKKAAPGLSLIHLDAQQRAAFERASLPVRETYLRIGGPKAQTVLERLRAAVEQAERRLGVSPPPEQPNSSAQKD